MSQACRQPVLAYAKKHVCQACIGSTSFFSPSLALCIVLLVQPFLSSEAFINVFVDGIENSTQHVLVQQDTEL
jgi:hypothetical protein